MRKMLIFGITATLLEILTTFVHTGALSLEQEAESEVHQYFTHALTKCGDKYVSTSKDVLLLKRDVIYEYLEASLKVRPGRVTDIDQLHGIEWQGMFTTSAKAHRANRVRILWVCALLDEGRRRWASPPIAVPQQPGLALLSSMILRYALASHTSPAATALRTVDYAAAPADAARMRWRKKSTPARP
jgi:hypothetical protein